MTDTRNTQMVAPPGPLPEYVVVPGDRPDEYVVIVHGQALLAPTLVAVDFPDGHRVSVLLVREGHEEADKAECRACLYQPRDRPLGKAGERMD